MADEKICLVRDAVNIIETVTQSRHHDVLYDVLRTAIGIHDFGHQFRPFQKASHVGTNRVEAETLSFDF